RALPFARWQRVDERDGIVALYRQTRRILEEPAARREGASRYSQWAAVDAQAQRPRPIHARSEQLRGKIKRPTRRQNRAGRRGYSPAGWDQGGTRGTILSPASIFNPTTSPPGPCPADWRAWWREERVRCGTDWDTLGRAAARALWRIGLTSSACWSST